MWLALAFDMDLEALVEQVVQVMVFQDTLDKEVLPGELQMLVDVVAKGKKEVDKGVCVLGPQMVLHVSVEAKRGG